MNYFDAITKRTNELDALANQYLSKLEFIPNDIVMDRIWKVAKGIFLKANENWDDVPEWVALTMDYAIPYSLKPNNGSIYFALGFSVASQDAHLRNLLEIAEGRETKALDFPCLAEKNIVEQYSKLK